MLTVLLLACATDTGSTDPDSAGGDTADTADSGGETGDTAAAFYSDDAIKDIEKTVKADMRGHYASGAQIAVWHGGELVYVQSFGSKDPDDETALVDDTTLFQIGSDTKKITALAALQQVEAGKLSLEDAVADVVPAVDLVESPTWSDEATLRLLLSHQGGLVDYTPWEEDNDDARLAEIATTTFTENAWAMSAPCACWNYANPNFSIAGLVTETAAEKPWADVVEDDVFTPLGLADTYARRDEVKARGNYAIGTGYTIVDPDPFDSWDTPSYTLGTVGIDDTVDNAFTRPAGMVWSTASDMATFGSFFIHGDPSVLSDSLRGEITTGQVRTYPAWDAQTYGMGWFLSDWISTYEGVYATPFWSHGGNTLTMTSLTWIFPEKDLSISILSNGYGDDFTNTALALVSGSGLLTDPVEAPDVPDEETDHAQLVGDYWDHEIGTVSITDVDGALTVSAPGLDALGASYDPVLEPAGITDVYLFTLEGAGYDLTFIPDDTGTYRWLRNRQFVGERLDINALAPVHADPTGFWTRLLLSAAEPDRTARPYTTR